MFRRISDNFRRDIPEAKQFLYPDDDLRISRKEAGLGIGLGIGEALMRGAPLRALMEGGKRINEINNRPIAYPSMHRKYLDNKYGKGGWDVYKDRYENEQRNLDFYYNEQDLGNGNTYIQRENKRFAGEALSDEWLEDIKAHGIEQDMLEEAIELNRQEKTMRDYFGDREYEALINRFNPSKTSEQQTARDLIFRGKLNPQPDRFLGADVSAPVYGIDSSSSEPKKKSEVRRDVLVTENPDGTYDFNRGNVLTEILNPEDNTKMMKEWEKENIRKSQGRKAFNEIAGEYYGQQALKMQGNTAPLGRDRRGRMIVGYDDVSTGGSQQLAEGYDYAYIDPETGYRVADYQTSSGKDPYLNMSLFKGSELRPGDEKEFVRNLREAARVNPNADFDGLLTYLNDTGVYGGPSYRAMDKVVIRDREGNATGRVKRVPLQSGFRAGKMTSDGKFFEETNQGTYKNNEVIYAINDDLDSPAGLQPQSLVQLDAAKMRNRFVDLIKNGEFDVFINKDGSVGARVLPEKEDLVNMLPNYQMKVLTQPYAFENNPYLKREYLNS